MTMDSVLKVKVNKKNVANFALVREPFGLDMISLISSNCSPAN